jgi:spectinomycin phosphotransferase
VREPPPEVADLDVLTAVCHAWQVDVDAVEHLPVGFGAHHWAASRDGRPVLFVTLDQLGRRHSATSLESAYAGAAALAASGLEFVLASLRGAMGRFTVPFAGGALSCTPWRAGGVVGEGADIDPALARPNAAMLAQLHATAPPPAIPVWHPLVEPHFPERLTDRLNEPWPTGPYGEPARNALAARQRELRRWTARYVALAEQTSERPWVATHGEPHAGNQLWAENGVLLVDWESLALAPRERDLRPLVGSGYADLVDPDLAMLEMFDLEWRLDEIAQYADWFSSAHDGTASDAVAFGGLVAELDRPDWSLPASL